MTPQDQENFEKALQTSEFLLQDIKALKESPSVGVSEWASRIQFAAAELNREITKVCTKFA